MSFAGWYSSVEAIERRLTWLLSSLSKDESFVCLVGFGLEVSAINASRTCQDCLRRPRLPMSSSCRWVRLLRHRCEEYSDLCRVVPTGFLGRLQIELKEGLPLWPLSLAASVLGRMVVVVSVLLPWSMTFRSPVLTRCKIAAVHK